MSGKQDKTGKDQASGQGDTQTKGRRSGSKTRDQGIDSKFVMECLWAESMGDGLLYAALHKGRYVYNKAAGEWMYWDGHCLRRDVMDLALADAESVALRYAQELPRIAEQISKAAGSGNKDDVKMFELVRDALKARIKKLRNKTGRQACLEFAHTAPKKQYLAIEGTELDQNPWLFACANGVLDLRTGELRKGKMSDMISKKSPVEWKGIDEPCPIWELALWEMLENDSKILFLQRWAGYCLCGDVTEQRFVSLSGDGRNGKGIYSETLLRVLGEYGGPIQAEMLLDQGRGKSSSGPTPDIMSLYGRRLALASESDEARRFSPSRIKWITGNDTLVGRYPHDKMETQFHPSHKLMLMTNNDPHAPSDDFAFWERILKVDFPFMFVERPSKANHKPRDYDLKRKLQDELSGILAWCVRGFLDWQVGRLDPPIVIREATEEYQRGEDVVQDWVDARCYVEQDRERIYNVSTSGSDLYQNFAEWYKDNVGHRVPSGQWFGRRMSKKFPKEKKGIMSYFGIGLLSE